MPYLQTQFTTVGGIQPAAEAPVYNESDLEETISISLVGDFNEQLSNISRTMQQQLAQKQVIRQELIELQQYNSRTTVTTPTGQEAVTVTNQEYNRIVGNSAFGGLQFERMPDGSGYYLKKESLGGLIETKQERLAGLNSNSELTMLQIQSLVDQRKNALVMLSNLIASKNETLTGIIRNLKN